MKFLFDVKKFAWRKARKANEKVKNKSGDENISRETAPKDYFSRRELSILKPEIFMAL
ncbi:hypothetical protein ACXYXE_003157 [Cronobacter dublinensis]|uniref:hypothetical protein n=1 Tax=Cronobacter dublinensis TaxID=413497 RepID=UPI0024AE6D7C|nr:hypothetical protein [Cronobacter dublinensis]MDI6446800.1 hypothetical protein [Cronobacter dublinensis]